MSQLGDGFNSEADGSGDGKTICPRVWPGGFRDTGQTILPLYPTVTANRKQDTPGQKILFGDLVLRGLRVPDGGFSGFERVLPMVSLGGLVIIATKAGVPVWTGHLYTLLALYSIFVGFLSTEFLLRGEQRLRVRIANGLEKRNGSESIICTPFLRIVAASWSTLSIGLQIHSQVQHNEDLTFLMGVVSGTVTGLGVVTLYWVWLTIRLATRGRAMVSDQKEPSDVGPRLFGKEVGGEAVY